MTRLPQIPSDTRPGHWYDDGVRFRCLGPECGDCCSGKHGPGAVWLGREEILRLADFLSLTVKELRQRYLRRIRGRTSLRERANFDCVFYRPGEGCSVYEARPTQCRTYPFWGRILASRTTWGYEAEQCPGIDVAETLDPEDAYSVEVPGEEVSRLLAIDQKRKRK